MKVRRTLDQHFQSKLFQIVGDPGWNPHSSTAEVCRGIYLGGTCHVVRQAVFSALSAWHPGSQFFSMPAAIQIFLTATTFHGRSVCFLHRDTERKRERESKGVKARAVPEL